MTTKKLVPRASGEGAMGVDDNAWGEAYYDTGNFNKGLFVSGHNITQVIAETVTQGGLGGEWTRNGLNIYYNGGNVGIGAANPGAKLHLAGDASSIIRLENTDLAIPANRIIGGLEFEKRDPSGQGAGVVGGLRMYSEDANGASTYLALSTTSTASLDQEVMRIDAAGNVGIGTTNPGRLLHLSYNSALVYDSSQMQRDDVNIYTRNTNETNGCYSAIDFVAGFASAIIAGVRTSTGSSALTFGTTIAGSNDTTEKMRIDSAGNVGIGTTNPSALLEAYKDSSDEYDDFSYAIPVLKITNANTTAAKPHSLIAFRLDKNGGDGYLGFITEGSTANTQHFVLGGQGSGEHLRINSNGNVGIGTTSPTNALNVIRSSTSGVPVAWLHNSNNTTTGNFGTVVSCVNNNPSVNVFQVRSNNSTHTNGNGLFTVKGDGNVGIGTTNPGARLDVFGSSSSLKFTRDAGDRSAEMLYDGIKFLIKAPSDDRVSIADSSSNEILTVNPNDGNVGIGTTTPSEKLEVRGHLRFGPTAYGSVREGSIMNLPQNGFYDLLLHNAFQGFLIVSITSTGNANIRTYATYSVFGRGSDFSFTLITSENGAVGGVAFALSRNSTTGAIRLSNASNLTCQSTMVFYGSTSF